MRCDDVTERLSLALDGALDPTERDALDAHVTTCPTCTAFERSATRVRQHLRYELVQDVPDVEARVLQAIRIAPGPERRSARRATHPQRTRWLVPAAALLAGVVAGASFIGPRTGDSGNVAVAADLSSRVLAAQLRVDALDATISIVERGWTDAVPERTYRGRIDYRAPESLTITLDDTTRYPSNAWRANDVRTVVDRDQAWRTGLAACPREAQPGCTPAPLRALGAVEREPFPDAAPAPLDLVVPVGSFAGAGASASLGERTIDGHDAVGVEVTVAQVAPMLDGIIGNGNWRELHSTDRVQLWLERGGLVPLRFDVIPADSAERARWAAHRGYADDPGEPILEVALHDVRIGATAPLDVAAAPSGTTERRQGFRELPAEQVPAPTPAELPPGMAAYRAGVVETASGPVVGVRTWTDGRGWLKVRATSEWTGGRLFGDPGTPVRAVDLPGGGVAYVGDGGRRVAVHGAGTDAVVTGSVSTATLLRVAGGLGIAGEPVPETWAEAATATVADAGAAVPGVLVPPRLAGFSAPAIRVDGDVVTLAAAGPGDRGFELFEAPGAALTPPVDPDVRGVRVRGTAGRYSPEKGELDWLENGLAVTLRSRTLSLGELVRIAQELRPA